MRLSLAALLLQLLCSGAQLDFSGRVSHGQNYHHRISEHLWFCLFEEPDANGGGWRISVQENGCSPTSHDFVAVATPPIYGVNAREIEGWHFDPGANAPKNVREFSFVLTDPDWRQLISDLNTYQDAGKMLKEMEGLGWGTGILTITRMGRRSSSGKSIFAYMNFRVTLNIPDR